MELENLGPGSHLISFSYLAFPLARFSISQAFGGSRLSLSFGENELSWKLHYFPCLMCANFSHTAISLLRPFGMHSVVFGVHHRVPGLPSVNYQQSCRCVIIHAVGCLSAPGRVCQGPFQEFIEKHSNLH